MSNRRELLVGDDDHAREIGDRVDRAGAERGQVEHHVADRAAPPSRAACATPSDVDRAVLQRVGGGRAGRRRPCVGVTRPRKTASSRRCVFWSASTHGEARLGPEHTPPRRRATGAGRRAASARGATRASSVGEVHRDRRRADAALGADDAERPRRALGAWRAALTRADSAATSSACRNRLDDAFGDAGSASPRASARARAARATSTIAVCGMLPLQLRRARRGNCAAPRRSTTSTARRPRRRAVPAPPASDAGHRRRAQAGRGQHRARGRDLAAPTTTDLSGDRATAHRTSTTE